MAVHAVPASPSGGSRSEGAIRKEMGTIAIQTQCCLQERDDHETDEEEGSQEEKVQLVEPVSWRSGGGLAGASRTGHSSQEERFGNNPRAWLGPFRYM